MKIVCLDTEELMAPSLVGSVSHADVLDILTPVMILLASAMTASTILMAATVITACQVSMAIQLMAQMRTVFAVPVLWA